jgi:S1-C subfamily serine protease
MKTRIGFLALVMALLLLPAVRAEEEGNVWEKRAADRAPSVVFVKYVLKIQMSNGVETREEERNREVLGVLVGERGLIMSSNSHFDPAAALPARMRSQVKGTPTDIKVLFGSEEKEYEAQIVARDSVLDLAFLQILDLEGRELKVLDLKVGADPVLGQELYGISRMGRAYDCAPVVTRLFVGSTLSKPRQMWGASGELPSPGLPVFNHQDQPAAIVSMQEGSVGVGGGGRRRPFLLPISAIQKSLQMATERAAEALDAASEAGGEDTDTESPEPEDEPAPEDDGGGEE